MKLIFDTDTPDQWTAHVNITPTVWFEGHGTTALDATCTLVDLLAEQVCQ